MPEGRSVGHVELDGETYLVREHSAAYQPPKYIKECKALSRDVEFRDGRIQVYAGNRSDFRVTFRFNGVWCYIPKDGNDGKQNPQQKLMTQLNNGFRIEASNELIEETFRSPFLK